MLWIYVFAGFAALGALAYLAGSQLPEDHVASVSADYAAAPEAIWATVTDARSFMAWRSGLKRVDVNGELITEHSSFGAMTYRFVDQREPTHVRTQVSEEGARERGFLGSWTFDITPMPGGSRVTITERGKIFSPLFRLLAHHVFGLEATMRQYHQDLAKRLG